MATISIYHIQITIGPLMSTPANWAPHFQWPNFSQRKLARRKSGISGPGAQLATQEYAGIWDDDLVTCVRIPGHLPAWQRHSLQRKKNKNQYLSIIFLDDIYIKNQSLNSKTKENHFPKIFVIDINAHICQKDSILLSMKIYTKKIESLINVTAGFSCKTLLRS